MNIKAEIAASIASAFKELFDAELGQEAIVLQPTRKDFAGSHTFVCFPFLKQSKKGPEQTGAALGEFVKNEVEAVANYNVVKGFLNFELSDAVWIEQFNATCANSNFGQLPVSGKEIMVEYSSPNTNKPLHLGHLRNNFLGYSVAEILKANGHKVSKVQIINDRGVHICKSMLAWQKFGAGQTPASSGKKGDKLVGDYYVKFDQEYKKEIEQLVADGVDPEQAKKEAPLIQEVQTMLKLWEDRDEAVVSLWKKMNGWVYEGFDATYKRMGVDFDKLYYESDTYLLGKDEVSKGIDKGVFFKKEDGSVWVDLTGDGLDEKLLLRGDGTSLYMTQDIGTAILRFRDCPALSQQIYTVGNEQEYHFKVLFLILDKLGFEWAKECYHLSYGMVDLPSGKMKSREGTVVDADDLMQEVHEAAKERTEELGKIDGFSEQEANDLYETIGLAALKYYLLKVDPRKRMMFDPNESVELHGNTGPFIQYVHARTSAVVRKATELGLFESIESGTGVADLQPIEQALIQQIVGYEDKLKEAAKEYSPAIIAQFSYELAKEYNKFYSEVSIFNEPDQEKLKFRVLLSAVVGKTLKKSMALLGANCPDRM